MFDQLLQNASFGVLLAFFVFVVLFAKHIWRTFSQKISAYQKSVSDKAQEAESLLKEAQDFLKKAQKAANMRARKIIKIRESAQKQIAHIEKNGLQEIHIFREQTTQKTADDRQKLEKIFQRKLADDTLTIILNNVEKDLKTSPRGTLPHLDQHLDTLFGP